MMLFGEIHPKTFECYHQFGGGEIDFRNKIFHYFSGYKRKTPALGHSMLPARFETYS